LTVCALLQGVPAAALRHKLKTLKGTIWAGVADKMAGSNGNAADRLLEALAGKRLAGQSEDETRRYCLAQITRWDVHVDDWLAVDPVFKRRAELPRRTVEEVAGLFSGTRWLWQDWIPRGYLSMIAGKPGAGKSYVAAWLATNAIMGGHFPDDRPTAEDRELAEVMWIDTEATQPLLIERLKLLAAPTTRFWWPLDPKAPGEPFPPVMLSDERWVGIVADLALQHRPVWIIVDALRGAHSADENSSEVQTMLGSAAAIARDVGCAFTFIHHLRKGQKGDKGEVTIDMVRGSSAIVAMMRVIVAVDAPDPTREEKRMRVIKSNLGLCPKPIGIQVDARGPMTLDQAPNVPRGLSAVARAEEFLLAQLQSGPRGVDDLVECAAALGITKRSLQRARSQLKLQPVKLEGHWELSLPPREGQEPPPF